MRVFVAGASGAIGTRLVPQLVDRGHEVIGTSRSAEKAEHIRALGAEPVALDLLDRAAVRRAVLEAEPDAIVHQATALADLNFSRNFDRTFATTNRLRTEGTDALLAAAREAGVDRFVAQSFASYRTAREGASGQDRGRPARSRPAREGARVERRDAPPRGGGHESRRDRASLRRLLRRRQRRADRAGAQAAVPDHRRRRGRRFVDPSRRRRRGDRARARTRRAGHLQRRRRRARAGARVAAGARRRARRRATPPLSPLARAAGRRRRGGRDGDRGARRLERQGQARARLGAALPQLARGLRGRLRVDRPGGAEHRASRS